MPTPISRAIIVDDNDSRITYSGSWFSDDSGRLNTMGNFGPPMLGTLHGTNSTASLTYTFSGTDLKVTNTNQFNKPTGLNITCLVDNESLPVIITTAPLNNVLLCQKYGLANTQHIFVLNAVVTNEETFWFDYLRYLPSASVPLDKAPLSIQHVDNQLRSGLSAGWNTFSPGFETTQTGAQFTFPFSGVSLTWYGFYDPSLPWDTSLKTAAYSIDGGSPISFNTLVDAGNRTNKPTGVRYNQVLFQTDDLPNANHELKVTYQATNTSTPLTLQFLVVNPNPRDSAVSASTAPVAPPLPTSGSSRKAVNPGATVGAVIAVVAVVALLATFFLVLRRRKNNGYRRPKSGLALEMAEPVLPFKPIENQDHVYTHPLGAMSANTFSTQSTNTGPSHVIPSPTSNPFSDNNASANSSRLQPSSAMQPHSIQIVELTPNGRILHSREPLLSGSGKGQIPMHVATTVVQDEDSGLRLPQSPDDCRVEILPPSYSRD